jgi:hypothetical protein
MPNLRKMKSTSALDRPSKHSRGSSGDRDDGNVGGGLPRLEIDEAKRRELITAARQQREKVERERAERFGGGSVGSQGSVAAAAEVVPGTSSVGGSSSMTPDRMMSRVDGPVPMELDLAELP